MAAEAKVGLLVLDMAQAKLVALIVIPLEVAGLEAAEMVRKPPRAAVRAAGEVIPAYLAEAQGAQALFMAAVVVEGVRQILVQYPVLAVQVEMVV